jgi:N2-acetyl-L-2,4-diaminobutanoate deacetylase
MARRADVGDGFALDIHEVTGGEPGPVLAVLGGVHGDELEGVTATRILLRHLRNGGFRGTVRAVPVCNPAAFTARQRSSPVDGANLARVFPGAPDGTVTQRIAHVLTTQVISGASMLIDLHSAGAAYEMPVFAGYVAGTPDEDLAREACRVFAAPFLWEHVGTNPGRSLSTAADLGVPAIYVEGSGGGGLVGSDLDTYVGGVLRVMRLLGMTVTAPEAEAPPTLLTGGDGNTDAQLACSVAGFCVTRVRSGAEVTRGAVVADILDDEGNAAEQIRSPQEGTVMMLRRLATVRPGDGIVMLGPRQASPADLSES